MTDRHPYVTRRSWRGVVAVALLIASGSPAGAGCPELRRLAEASLPSQVGNPLAVAKLLRPNIAQPQLPDYLSDPVQARPALAMLRASGLRPERKSCRLGARSRNAAAVSAASSSLCRLRSRSDGGGHIDLALGEISVTGTTAGAGIARGIVSPTSEMALVQTALTAARTWGVPSTEIERTAGGILVERPMSSNAGGATRVTARRHVGGVPVHGSVLEALLDDQGRVVRTDIRWPRFCIDPVSASDLQARLVTRPQMIDQVVRAVEERIGCGTLGRLSATVVYARDAETSCYLPALSVQPMQKPAADAHAEGPQQPLVLALIGSASAALTRPASDIPRNGSAHVIGIVPQEVAKNLR